MLFVRKLTEHEVVTLKELIKHHSNHRARTRAHAVLLSNDGRTRSDIATICFAEDCDTVSSWLKRWERMGLSGLFDKYRSGRPIILNDEEKVEAVNCVNDSPRNLRVALFELCKKVKKKLSLDTLKRVLRANNFSWRRMRKSLKNKRNNEEFEKSKAEIAVLKERHNAGEIGLNFFDEAGVSLTPVVPYAWQLKGQTIELPSSRSQRANILGFMSLDCQLESYVFNCNITADIVVSCFDKFVKKITKTTYVIIDNASIHTCKLFQAKIEDWKEQKLIIKFLPKYSPELNLIEILWRFIKYCWLPLDAYENIKTLNDKLDEVLANVGEKYRITFA